MTKDELDRLLELKEKVDIYERAFLDLLFAVKTDKTIIVPQTGNEVVDAVFNAVFELRKGVLSPTLVPASEEAQNNKENEVQNI
jgi:hypothetical protein